jgi:hypothetical protein
LPGQRPLAVVAARIYPPRTTPRTPARRFVARIANALKVPEAWAVEVAARALAPLVPAGVVLVPVPGSSGSSRASRRLAREIGRLRGLRVLDGLVRVPGASSLARRRRGLPGLGPDRIVHRWRGARPRAPVWLVDNVASTGATALSAARALGRPATLLVYARVPDVRGRAQVEASLRAGRPVPRHVLARYPEFADRKRPAGRSRATLRRRAT